MLGIGKQERQMTSQLQRYEQEFGDVEGFFVPESQAAWDFLLTCQNDMRVPGSFVEIGVWKGKSAYLGALHCSKENRIGLVDIQDIGTVSERIKALSGAVVSTFIGKSLDFAQSPIVRELAPARWFPIDGDHTGYATTTDLATASSILGDQGIICVDDFFNPRYPQLTGAVYRWLFANSDLKMFLCGGNKAYICRSEHYALYESLVRKFLAQHLQAAGVSVTLAKTSYVHDGGCFAIEPRQLDRDIIGLDHDQDQIVF
jgi:hypothetical protein